jgi:rubrerythrin
VSRIPRIQEHLKTGFTAEAAAAARFRAYAHRAQEDGLPRLAERWRELAREKDELARRQLEAAAKVHGGATDLATEIAEERYENEVLYPRLIRDSAADPAVGVFQRVIEEQQDHLARLEALRRALGASQGDVAMPAEVTKAGEPVTAST